MATTYRSARPGHVLRITISVGGPLRENYLRGVTDTANSDEWDTEIGWPISAHD
jgi:hypothetical protein